MMAMRRAVFDLNQDAESKRNHIRAEVCMRHVPPKTRPMRTRNNRATNEKCVFEHSDVLLFSASNAQIDL